MPRLLHASFFFGRGACSSPALRENDKRIPPKQRGFEIAACSGKERIPPAACLSILAKLWRYALMIIVSDNHAYRMLTPFAPVIRGHKCLFGAIPPLPHPKWAQSVAPAVRCGRLKPLIPPRPAGAAACTHVPCVLPPRGRAPKQTCYSGLNRHRLGACHVGTALKGRTATASPYPDHHP